MAQNIKKSKIWTVEVFKNLGFPTIFPALLSP